MNSWSRSQQSFRYHPKGTCCAISDIIVLQSLILCMNSVQVVMPDRKKSDEKRVQVIVFVVIITHLPRQLQIKRLLCGNMLQMLTMDSTNVLCVIDCQGNSISGLMMSKSTNIFIILNSHPWTLKRSRQHPVKFIIIINSDQRDFHHITMIIGPIDFGNAKKHDIGS